jgi:hypothetical protein
MIPGASLLTRRPQAAANDDAVQLAASYGDRRLRNAERAAWIALGCQLVAMFFLSWVIYHRWSNTWDFAIRYQGWWGISHGNLNPYASVAGRYFVQDHFELINWPLAPISLLWPHGLWPLWIQDLMVVGGEVGAVLIVADSVRSGRWKSRVPGWTAVCLVALMLVANPWIYDSIAFDFHYQVLGAACFALLACREMIRGSRWQLLLWAVLCLLCGDIASTYLAAVGVAGIIAGGKQRRRGLALVGMGLAWYALSDLAGGNQGSSIAGHYGYLVGAARTASLTPIGLAKGLLLHPERGLGRLWAHRLDLWGYAASAGLIGLLTPWAIVPLLVLLEIGLTGGTTAAGSAYQSFGAVLFLIPLSVLALGGVGREGHETAISASLRLFRRPIRRWQRASHRLRRLWIEDRRRAIAYAGAAILAVNAIGWGVVWIPQVPSEWIRVSAATSSALDAANVVIPPTAEVVASQGIIGRFADRQWLYRITGDALIPLRTPTIYFVVLPNAGIESLSVQTSQGIIGQLAGPLHARLLIARDGVWVFALRRPPDRTVVQFASTYDSLPAWVGRSNTGRRILSGPETDWHMAKTSERAGYVLFGTEWDENPGTYRMTTTIADTASVNLEVWDSSAHVVISRQQLLPTRGFETVETTFKLKKVNQLQPFGGIGPFRYLPTSSPLGDRIEVRIWSGAGPTQVSVYTIEMQPIH